MNQLSSIQKSIWMAQSRSPLSPLFNIGGYVKLFGLTDEAHFLQTFRLITRQMDVLSQTSGQLEDLAMDSNKGGDSLEEIICLIDCSARSNPLRYVMNLVDEDIRIPFAQSDLLFKGILFKLSDLEYLWYVKAHHLVTDGFSMGLLFRKVMAVYNAPLLNVPSVSVNNIFPYSAFVADEQKYQSSDQYDEDEKFWHERLSKVVGNKLFGSCLLPVSQKSMKAGRFEAGITRNLFKKVEAYCSQFNCSVPHFYITLLLAISKAYNNAPGVLGIPVFNRLSRNSKNTFGPFVNMVPLYCQLDDQLSFVENMKLVKDELNQCFRHKRYPLIDILEKLEQHENIYNVTFSYQKIDYLSSVNDNPNEVVFLSGSEQQEDMIFHLLDFSEGGDLVLAVDYLIGSFSLEVIQGIVAAILRMTENLVTLPDLPLRETGYIGDEERKKLLYDFNQTERHYEGHTLVAELFEQAAKQHPAATALVFREKQFSYSEINSQANRMAHYLRNTHNVSREVPVAIILDRDEWMVIAMIAVLKSGGYYIPIHPETPETRIAYILDDAGCQQQIDGEFLSKFSLIADGYSAQNPDHINQSNDLNCLIYTSGSTGLPKGAMLENSGIVNQIFSKIDLLGFKEGEVLCHNSHLHFVGGIWQLWAPLVLGGKVVLCDDDELTDIRQVVNKAEAFKSRVIEVIPSQLNEHLNDESGLSFAKLEILVLTGERLNMENVRRCYRTNDRLCIMNGYGQTESSNDTACHILNKQTTGDVILIGRPIANTRHYILNESLGLVPIGVTGELYTSGAGLSRGYLNRPDLTAEKFIQNPYLKGGRMYRTGDLVRWLPSGDIEFIGRKDEQVKIRGYRIEPGEVKDVLLQHPKVEEAVILARGTEGENNELVAYFVSESGVDGGELRSYLRDRLPSYMVPVHYVQLESMPLLSNGKIDKHSLPAPSYGDIGTAYVKPSTATESMLASLWSSLLGVAEDLVGRDDDFFELGGHSLKAVRLLSRIQAEFSVVVSLSELFGNPRISDLAVLIDSKQAKAVVPIRTIPESDSYALSSAQRRLWVLCQFPESSMAYNQVSGYLLKGHLDVTGLEESFNKVIARHEILRTVIREDETGMPRQYVLSVSSGGLKLKQTDLRGFASKGVEDLKPLITSEFRRAFDLSTGPLVRADLYRLSADEWLLTYSMHHIISDGWSMGLLIREVLMFYKQYLGGRSDLLPPSPGIQYKDYASWQLERLQSGILGEDKSYWLSQFGEGVPVLELPTDRVRSSVKTYNGGNVVRELGAELTSGITAICRAHSATLFMGLLAGVNALLYRYTGQTDITIGSPTAGRDHGDLEDQLGFYVNTLALRTRFSGSENYGQLLNLIREVTLSAYDHQSYPFDELVEALDIRRDLSRSPLFDVMVVLQNNDQIAISDEGLPDLEINPVLDAEQPGSKFDLTFTFTEAGEGLVLVLEFNSDLYDQATAERMGAHLEQLLDALVSSPDTGISSVEYLTADQRHTLLEEFNNTSVAYPEDKTVIDLFKEQVELHRDKTAVVSGSKSLTYQELDERSDLLAKYL
ncbi:amino acid adenylation domain-containing protein, partial [Mucilaginibacter oryzae]